MRKKLLAVLAVLAAATAVATARVGIRGTTVSPVGGTISAPRAARNPESSPRAAAGANNSSTLQSPAAGKLGELLLSPPDPFTKGLGTSGESAHSAVEVLRAGAQTGDKALLTEIAGLPKNCPGCAAFFSQVRDTYSRDGLTTDERIYLSSALAASGRAENQEFLYDQFRRAAADPTVALVPPATLARQLERNQQGGPLAGDVVDQVANDLQSENPYIRDAAISLLTRQHSLQAAQSLYEYTVNSSDRDGFYRQGMGLGLMTPEPDAFPYLDDLVRKQDQYSHLALKALLNAGSEGISRAVSILQDLQSPDPNRTLIQGAVDHIPMYGPSLALMRSLQGSSNPTVAELAQEVVREHDSREAALKKGIEYNDNYAAGIIMPTPGPF